MDFLAPFLSLWICDCFPFVLVWGPEQCIFSAVVSTMCTAPGDVEKQRWLGRLSATVSRGEDISGQLERW